MSEIKRFKINDFMNKIYSLQKLETSRNTILYIDMHEDVLKDLILDPDFDSFVIGRGVIGRDDLENTLKCRIFTHTNNEREVIAITHRMELIL